MDFKLLKVSIKVIFICSCLWILYLYYVTLLNIRLIIILHPLAKLTLGPCKGTPEDLQSQKIKSSKSNCSHIHLKKFNCGKDLIVFFNFGKFSNFCR